MFRHTMNVPGTLAERLLLLQETRGAVGLFMPLLSSFAVHISGVDLALTKV